MDIFDVICVADEGLKLHIFVLPHVNRSCFGGIDEWRKRLIVKVRASPQNNAANKEVIELIEKITKCRCEIVCGGKSRQKTVLIHGNKEEVLLFLKDALRVDSSIRNLV